MVDIHSKKLTEGMRILNQSRWFLNSPRFISLKIKLKLIVFRKYDLVVEKMDNINYIFCYFFIQYFFKPFFVQFRNEAQLCPTLGDCMDTYA